MSKDKNSKQNNYQNNGQSSGQNSMRKTEGNLLYLDADAELDERVEDLVGRMTLEEKVSQMVYTVAAIPRLGIPEYNYWNEYLHGVARAGIAPVFQ